MNARHRTSLLDPVQIPDLIGVKERHYLDRTGLQPQHSDVDFMRYVAMNQGGDSLSSFDGFIPAGRDYKTLPDPADPILVGVATATKSYTPSPSTHIRSNLHTIRTRLTRLVRGGRKSFRLKAAPDPTHLPLYSNNKLTPALGFKVPANHKSRFEIMSTSVGTDPQPHSANQARNRLLQGAVSQRCLVPEYVRSQRLVCHARRLV